MFKPSHVPQSDRGTNLNSHPINHKIRQLTSLAIIPARGGSKRIPRKNVKHFLGQPILAYSLKAAISSQLFDEVMVSTDDEEIKKIAEKNGAEVPFLRSESNSGDFATTVDVAIEVIKQYKTIGKEFDYICILYPTALFVTPDKLQLAFKKLTEKGYDSVFPLIRYSTAIQRALRWDNGKVEMIHPEHVNSRTQDLEPSFFDAGQFYWIQPDAILEKKKLWTDNSGAILLSELEAQDIDAPDDWELAEFKYRRIVMPRKIS